MDKEKVLRIRKLRIFAILMRSAEIEAEKKNSLRANLIKNVKPLQITNPYENLNTCFVDVKCGKQKRRERRAKERKQLKNKP